MTADITALISNCPACQKFQSKQPPETLRNELPTTQPWTSLTTDIFELNGKSYLIVVDHYSKFIVVRRVTDHSAEQTIAKFLEIFSEFGVPDEIRSDRGTNYTSSLFLAFCKGLDIKLSFSSAYHHSGNPAEHSVQIVKNIMKKCKYTNTNWRLGLLKYLCTPLSEKLASPAELLAGRQFKGLQPTLHAKLTPNSSFSEQVKEQLVAKKEIEKSQHDKSAHDLQILAIGSTVMYYDHKSKSWLVGRVTECQHDRAYLIETESGTMVSHNRHDIHPSSLTFTPLPKPSVKPMPNNGIVSNPGSVPVSGKVVKPVKLATANTSGPTDRHPVAKLNSGTTVGARTRSGRMVKKPNRLDL